MTYEETFDKIFNKIPVWYTDSDGNEYEVTIQASTRDGYAYITFMKEGTNIRVSTDELRA